MNDVELARELHRLKVPPASGSARERARHRALTAFGPGGTASDPAPRRLSWSWLAAGALAAVLLGTGLKWLHSPAREDLAGDRKILQQMQALFPHQVDAVVEENGKVDLSIAQAPVVGTDQPVVLLFRQGDRTIRVLSYSGHRVCVALDGGENCFEILATPAGGIILEGSDKVWIASEHPKIAGYTVHAQTLEAPL